MDEKITLKTLKAEKKKQEKISLLMLRKGFCHKRGQATMREIADEAGMATSSIYRFFSIRSDPHRRSSKNASKFNQILDKFFDEKKPEESLKKVLNII
jgi:undecaprenyl pyrophosphate synthase